MAPGWKQAFAKFKLEEEEPGALLATLDKLVLTNTHRFTRQEPIASSLPCSRSHAQYRRSPTPRYSPALSHTQHSSITKRHQETGDQTDYGVKREGQEEGISPTRTSRRAGSPGSPSRPGATGTAGTCCCAGASGSSQYRLSPIVSSRTILVQGHVAPGSTITTTGYPHQ